MVTARRPCCAHECTSEGPLKVSLVASAGEKFDADPPSTMSGIRAARMCQAGIIGEQEADSRQLQDIVVDDLELVRPSRTGSLIMDHRDGGRRTSPVACIVRRTHCNCVVTAVPVIPQPRRLERHGERVAAVRPGRQTAARLNLACTRPPPHTPRCRDSPPPPGVVCDRPRHRDRRQFAVGRPHLCGNRRNSNSRRPLVCQ